MSYQELTSLPSASSSFSKKSDVRRALSFLKPEANAAKPACKVLPRIARLLGGDFGGMKTDGRAAVGDPDPSFFFPSSSPSDSLNPGELTAAVDDRLLFWTGVVAAVPGDCLAASAVGERFLAMAGG